MLTSYGENFDAALPRGEHPRPQLRRDSWFSLNGPWEFAGSQKEQPPAAFSSAITVPFPPESRLSGIGRPTPKGFFLWYRRRFLLPEGFGGQRLLLHIDGADQRLSLWCNDQPAGEHAGGYTPFTADLTPLLQEENTLLIRVEDPGEQGGCGFGFQKRAFSWSGIWQSVWCEIVPNAYIDSLQIIPRPEDSAIELTVYPGGGAGEGQTCTAQIGSAVYELSTGLAYTLPVENAPLWTPDSPILCSLQVTLGEDTVSSYFAMRSFGCGNREDGAACFLLNGSPYFMNGVLYRPCWPDGLPTAPSDEALAGDILAAKSLGFNSIRLLDKVECDRFYYYCDRLGLLVLQSIPAGGRDNPPALRVKDSQYALYGRRDPESRRQYMRELRETIQLLRNHPSVVLWELFDEGRGQFDTESLQRFADDLDGSRAIDRSSGMEAGGSIRSYHSIGRPFRFVPDEQGRPVLLSAFGGLGQIAEGHSSGGRPRAAHIYDTPQGLRFALEDCYQGELRPAAAQGLAGCFYSQLTDVGSDVSGLISFDRKIFKLAPKQVKPLINLHF